MSMEERAEENESLWWLALSPGIWVVHFLASYITVAIWCEKAVPEGGPLGGARAAVVVYTVLALAGIAATGVRAWRRHAIEASTVPHDFDTRDARYRFLGFAVFLLSALSAVAIVYVALPFVFIGSCE